jgi:DNA excision repair protein ERCC-2
MHLDYEKREIVCSVGDLVYEEQQRRIGADRGDGFRRMWIGQEIHAQRAASRADEDPNYRAEVSVSHGVERGGWRVFVSGRIDGLSIDRDARRAVVEEVKSLHFELELASLFRSDRLQRNLFQLMLYAWFLSQREENAGLDFFPQLVLIDVVTAETRVVPAPFEPAEIALAFETTVDRIIGEVETAAVLRDAKRSFASSLVFPHATMRPFQKEMIDAVARAVRQSETLLVSAPTGVGKTVAAIYPALIESLRAGKKLFLLTSKTLQQEMATRVLSELNDGSFRVLRLRAKEKMCANDEVICHESFCPYANGYAEKMERNALISRIVTDLSYFDPDITFRMARDEQVCPFEVSLELLEHADVVVCDYNYIFDPYVGLKTYEEENDYSDTVLIIDEAHNLLDRGRGYYSPSLEEESLDRVAMHLASRPGCGAEGWQELLDELRAHLHDLAEPLDHAAEAKQLLCSPGRRLFANQRYEWERIITRYIAWKVEHRIIEEEDPVIDFYFRLIKFTNVLREEGDEFAHLVERAPRGVRLKIFCKDPSRFLGAIIASSHATIAMSATLEPFDFYRTTLGFPASRTAELSLPSPFPKENRKIVVVPSVDTTYRERGLHYATIGRIVADLASSSGGNFLALFPSYVFLQEVAARLPATDKNLIVQRSDMTDYERRSILAALRGGSLGNLILAVSGGMYAEGIDYEGDMLAGVFVVGPSLPAVTFEQELLKEYYDEQYGAGFEYAYLIPGMTRVIQSAGRVIRSEKDVGIIVLLCRRFTQPAYTKFFPAEWYGDSPRELVSSDPVGEVRQFFEAKRSPQLQIRFFDESESREPLVIRPQKRKRRKERTQ